MRVIVLLLTALSSLVHHGDHHQHAINRCTCTNWHSIMTRDERWIARHESGMNPHPSDVNTSSGARELGQLLPSTLAGLHLQPSWKPCVEVHHMRVYVDERYGSTAAAVEWWREHSWY